VSGLQALLKPLPALQDGCGAGVIRAVAELERDIAAPRLLDDFHAIENVLQGRLADLRVGISERAVPVNLVLKDIGIDRAHADTVLFSQAHHLTRALLPFRGIPKGVHGDAWAATREPVYLAGVIELFLDGGGSGWLNEFSTARPGVGESPGRDLNLERI
jgi:hypothetical protein